jgi:type VI secretion system protein ImpE
MEADNLLRLARRTEWLESGDGIYTGRGQRMLTTDQSEYSLLDVRLISFSSDSDAD